MNKLMQLGFKVFTLLVILSTVVGCVAPQSFTATARAGDTVTFAIGTLDNVKKSDVQLEYYSDSNPGVAIDITAGIRSIIRLYPDKTSLSYWELVAGPEGIDTIDAVVNFSSHGPWQSVAVVDLPETLPAGTGHVKFIMGGSVNYPPLMVKIDDVEVALTILAHDDGSAMLGSSHDFDFRRSAFNSNTTTGDLNKLEPLKQVVLKSLPSSLTPPLVSAASYKLTFSVSDQSGNDVTNTLTANDFAVVLDDSPAFIRGQTSLIWNKIDSVFNVSVLSPASPINPRFVRFSVVLSNIEDTASNGWTIDDQSASLQSVVYYAADGSEMTGPPPQVKVLFN